ncbi:methyl-accepting chemotaxis protein [Nocardioides pantholopis]|uniref:methyl-accepting chemotaxis protein n=1 Tax=Nocardioides pantholopis TaxID=2483798 RepID=UPI000FD6E4B4|nr:methyl-accepting chemotaxis protein [Nocardioides pantholopis]
MHLLSPARLTPLLGTAALLQLLVAALGLDATGPRLALLLAALLTVLAAVAVRTAVAGPLAAAAEHARRLARGDLSAAPEAAADPLLRAVADAGARTRTAMRDVVDSSAALHGTADAVAAAAESMTTAFAETAERAAAVSAAAGTVSHGVTVVSTGAAELRDSVSEIARTVTEAVDVAGQAVTMAGETTGVMAELGTASEEIGNVVRLITAIAEQTNLLALNATIEASRAGEAGRGFAVVAGEVKTLAQETARATEDITSRVQTLQRGTREAISSIERTRGVIERFSVYQGTIASAVEEQSATTAEMSRSLDEAADGSRAIAETVSAVASATALALEELTRTRHAARELAGLAGDLGSIAGRFEVPGREVVVHETGPEGGVALEVEGAVTVSHVPDLDAVVVRWLRHADDAVKPALGKQLELIRTHSLSTVIVDSSEAVGAYSTEINQWIGQEFVPQLGRTSLRGFVTVVPRSAVADLANKGWQEQDGSLGFSMVEVATPAEAERLARELHDRVAAR